MDPRGALIDPRALMEHRARMDPRAMVGGPDSRPQDSRLAPGPGQDPRMGPQSQDPRMGPQGQDPRMGPGPGQDPRMGPQSQDPRMGPLSQDPRSQGPPGAQGPRVQVQVPRLMSPQGSRARPDSHGSQDPRAR